MPSSHVVLDQVEIAFDDQRAVASAGLLLPATLAERLGIEQATDQLVDLGDRPGAARPGRKLLTLVHAMVAGADCIDDVELLRCGSTQAVLGHRVMAASTVGTWLRAFTFGHVRQLDKVTGEVLGRAWAAGAGPGDGPLVVDVDSNQGDQAQLFATWRYHALVTNRVETMVELDQDHRRHAVCELAIRDLKAGAGLAHLPSGRFAANAAWLGPPPWPTTCCAGPPASASAAATSRPSPRPCGGPCWCCPAG